MSVGTSHAERVARAARAAEVLCEALWEVLHEQLDARPDATITADPNDDRTQLAGKLAERVADVAATITLLADTQDSAVATPEDSAVAAPEDSAVVGPEDSAVVGRAPTPLHAARSPDAPPADLRSARPAARLIDERDDHAAGGERRSSYAELGLSLGAPLRAHAGAGRAAWIEIIEGALEQFARDRVPFAVLLVELLDVEHLRLGGRAAELPRLRRELESAFSRALEATGAMPAASLTAERPDRYWLLVPETAGLGAQLLAERLACAFGPVPGAGGEADPTGQYFAALSAQRSPMRARQNGGAVKLAVGIAACPENGREAATLAAHADAQLATVRAPGGPISSVAEPV